MESAPMRLMRAVLLDDILDEIALALPVEHPVQARLFEARCLALGERQAAVMAVEDEAAKATERAA